MNFKKKFLSVFVSILLAANVAVSAVGCGECTHEWGEWEISTQATCVAEGLKERACTKCSETETQPYATEEHDWAVATCTSPKKCKNCDK